MNILRIDWSDQLDGEIHLDNQFVNIKLILVNESYVEEVNKSHHKIYRLIHHRLKKNILNSILCWILSTNHFPSNKIEQEMLSIDWDDHQANEDNLKIQLHLQTNKSNLNSKNKLTGNNEVTMLDMHEFHFQP